MSQLVNLHLHTHSSLIDGLGRPDEIVARAKSFGQQAVALTDHGTMAGLPDMYRAGKKHGVHVIAGQEVYIVPDTKALGFGDKGESRDGRNFHLTLLAKNEQGYKDLVKLTSFAHERENFYRKPRIDHAMLRQVDTENLVCLSGCVMGELAESFLSHLWPLQPEGAKRYDEWLPAPAERLDDNEYILAGLESAREVMKFYRNLFPDRQYLYEFMWHNFAPESWVHKYLIPEAKRYGLPIVVTNDSHYVDASQSEAHNLLMSIQWRQSYCAKPDDPKHLDMVDSGLVLDRMEGFLPREDILEGIKNTERVADLCSGFKLTPLERKSVYMPKAKDDDGAITAKPIGRIRSLAERRLQGLCDRTPERAAEYVARFERELRVIKKLKYQHYFLVTASIIQRAKSKGIAVGAGRGSGAGSLVAFCLGITEIDPVAHDLLFERFLNPAKKSLPDFDTDFESDRIEEVFEDIVEQFGQDNVRRVSTYHRYAPKALMTDLLKTLPTGLSHDEVKAITKDLPEDTRDRKDESFMEVWWQSVRESDDAAALKLLAQAEKFPIEAYSHQFYGIRKSVSTHAAGVIITNGKVSLSEWVPNQLVASSGKTVTQFDMNDLSDMGFVKFDILSLGTLSQVAECIRLIGESPFPEFIDYDDEKTFKLITAGHTDGLFQLTGYAAKQVIKAIGGCHDFRDISAVMALGRPGAMKFVDAYREGRANPEAIEYADEDDKKILSPSYGMILYQEQVMALGWAIGMTDEEVSGDISLLGAIKKYSPTIMEKVEPIFREKAAAKGWKPHMIDRRWANILEYTGYGFNKAHSDCYADLAYRTAYLKANFPAAFIVSRLNQTEQMSDKKKKADLKQALVQDARRLKIKVLAPDVNKSQVGYCVEGDGIRWGLSNVKGVGVGAAREIIRNRPFTRDDWRDDDYGPRGGKITPHLLRVHNQKCNAGAVRALISLGAFPGFDPGEDRFANEFELLECNVTEHHNKKVLKQIKKRVVDAENAKILRKKKHGEYECYVGGVIHRIKEINTKSGRRMAFVDLQLGADEFSVTVFPQLWEGEYNYKSKRKVTTGFDQSAKRGRLAFVKAKRSWDATYGWGLVAEGMNIYR